MKVYNYEITYIDGHVDKFEDLTERIDMNAITQNPWWLLDCGDWSILIRTELIAKVREETEELDEFSSFDVALKRANYSRSKAMEILGVSERALFRWVSNHGMNWDSLKP